MFQIALVEDDRFYLSELIGYLKQYEKERNIKIEVTVFNDGEDIVTGYSAYFDIILMDIEMTFMDGMTAAENIRNVDSEVIIIFITNMPQYAIQGYKVDALDYVLKPVTYFAFSQRIDRALSKVSRREKRYLTIFARGTRVKLDVAAICYVEVQDHDLIYHTTEHRYITSGTMKDAEAQLAQADFFRCNRCYLVNLEYVEQVKNYELKVHTDIIQISRSRKRAFLDALNRYLNEEEK